MEGLEVNIAPPIYPANTTSEQLSRSLEAKRVEGTVASIGMLAMAAPVVVANVGWRAIGTFFLNEAKDEVLSLATNGASDVFDITKMATKGLKSLVKKIGKNSEGSVVIGEGMDRVTDAAKTLKKGGAENVGTFKPSKEAMEEWDKLTEGGTHLSDEAVKGTQLYKENQGWIKGAKESGKTIIDIGKDGRKNQSTFYKMERETVYD